MIEIKEKGKCCGCNACGDVCTQQAISFITDHEGFLYPEVNIELCVDCGLCEDVCPMLSKLEYLNRHKEPIVYAAYSKDERIRLDSTSGGIYSMLALSMFDKAAYVGGAVYNDDHSVSQIITSDISKLSDLRSSKYLQSESTGIYKEILSLLTEGKTVFYCACPCQICALYQFLGKEYDNLFTCDFVCRGVNSPKVFKKYMDMLEKRFGSKALEIKFKAKKWGWHNFSMRVNFANGKEYCKDRSHDLFFIGYLQSGNFARPSCYTCQFKNIPHAADITLGDFWGIENLDASMDQDKGTSLVMINSDKGKQLFDRIKENVIWKPFFLKDAIIGNPALKEPLISESINRHDFFADLEKFSFEDVAKKYYAIPSIKNNLIKTYRVYQARLKKLQVITETLKLSYQSWKTFININFVSNKVIRNVRMPFLNYGKTIIQIDKGATITLSAKLKMGVSQVNKSKMETRIHLGNNSKLIIDGEFTIFAGSYIRLEPNSTLILHGGFINENVQITVGDIVEIGAGLACARDVVIRSYDGHIITHCEGKALPNQASSRPIRIGKHVWIGQNAMLLKGITIGDGAVVAAGAIVTKDVPPRVAVAGVPAQVKKQNIEWT